MVFGPPPKGGFSPALATQVVATLPGVRHAPEQPHCA
jgi:hypothetical protein